MTVATTMIRLQPARRAIRTIRQAWRVMSGRRAMLMRSAQIRCAQVGDLWGSSSLDEGARRIARGVALQRRMSMPKGLRTKFGRSWQRVWSEVSRPCCNIWVTRSWENCDVYTARVCMWRRCRPMNERSFTYPGTLSTLWRSCEGWVFLLKESRYILISYFFTSNQ